MTYYQTTANEYLAIGGVPLNTPAWTHTNLHMLWSGPTTRGTDVLIPGADGVRPYPRRIDARRVTLELVVYGNIDWEGQTYRDWRRGLWLNLEHLRTNAFDPPNTGNGTRTLQLVLPEGSEFTPVSALDATVTVERFDVGTAINWFSVLATADIVIPEGDLT